MLQWVDTLHCIKFTCHVALPWGAILCIGCCSLNIGIYTRNKYIYIYTASDSCSSFNTCRTYITFGGELRRSRNLFIFAWIMSDNRLAQCPLCKCWHWNNCYKYVSHYSTCPGCAKLSAVKANSQVAPLLLYEPLPLRAECPDCCFWLLYREEPHDCPCTQVNPWCLGTWKNFCVDYYSVP